MTSKRKLNLSEYVNSIFTLGLVAALGLAIGYAGQWTKTELNPRNLIVLSCWIGLIFVLGAVRLVPQKIGIQLAFFVSSMGMAFIFAVFALYRHRDSGSLGDSQEFFRLATYNLNFGNPEGLNLSYPMSKLLNQALFDVGFHRLWLIPLISGVTFLVLVLFCPLISGYKLTVPWPLWGVTALLIFLSGSSLLYFFRTYMEQYFFGAAIFGLGLLLLTRGFYLNNIKALMAGAFLVGAAPLFHVLFLIFLLPVVAWSLYWLFMQTACRRELPRFLLLLITPICSFVIVIIIFRIPLNLGTLSSIGEPGSVRPWLSDFSSWQFTFLISFISLPIAFLTLAYFYSTSKHLDALSDGRKYALGIATILLFQWSIFVSVYWFLNGYDTDRDLIVIMALPLLMVLAVLLSEKQLLISRYVTFSLIFGSSVTAAVVTSFIEPAWY